MASAGTCTAPDHARLPPSSPIASALSLGRAGLGASELYVVKAGEFEVLQRRRGVNIRVNMKRRGDTFGEVALMFNCPRSATVAATQNAVVWVLEREAFRQYVREVQESESAQLELFLNSGKPASSQLCAWLGTKCWAPHTSAARHLRAANKAMHPLEPPAAPRVQSPS